jgi:hypothetical protein
MLDIINNYKGVDFELKERDYFDVFAIDFKKAINRQLTKDVRIIVYNTNFYYISGFLVSTICERCMEGDINHSCANMVKGIVGECKKPKYAYFSTSDVRHFSKNWYNHILLRSAKDVHDYTGGSNGYTTLEDFGKNAKRIMELQMRK